MGTKDSLAREDGIHVVVDELCHTPKVSPSKRSSARNLGASGNETTEGRNGFKNDSRKDGKSESKRTKRTTVVEKDEGSKDSHVAADRVDDSAVSGRLSSTASAPTSPSKRRGKNVALVEFVAGPSTENATTTENSPPPSTPAVPPSTAADSASTSVEAAVSKTEMKNVLLEELDQSIGSLENERADNLTELFFLQVI